MTRPVVLLLTARRLPDLAGDDQPLVAAFRDRGWQPRPTVWSGAIPDAELAIVRSCWDYTDDVDQFLATLDEIARRMPLWNPPGTIRWNAHKGYLLELAACGVPIPDSIVVRSAAPRPIADVAHRLGTGPLVVKPVVGASGAGIVLVDGHDRVSWERATAGRDVLVQRFVPEVVADGEWSLMYFHGAYSHAVLKRAAGDEFRVQEEHGGSVHHVEPDQVVRDGAERALDAVPHPWRYARVDGVVRGGRFLVMELELIEPALFLVGSEGAARLVGALLP
jgi:glutathione synthase/RimK-type ligase-like ATP-grasp enzyme